MGTLRGETSSGQKQNARRFLPRTGETQRLLHCLVRWPSFCSQALPARMRLGGLGVAPRAYETSALSRKCYQDLIGRLNQLLMQLVRFSQADTGFELEGCSHWHPGETAMDINTARPGGSLGAESDDRITEHIDIRRIEGIPYETC